MGNHNSTRWNGIRTRTRTDACLRLTFDRQLRTALREIEHAKKTGHNAGVKTILRWSSQGEPRGQIGLLLVGIAGAGTFAELVYYAGGTLIEEPVTITFTAQKIGGQCAWWVCPACTRRCGVLYCPPGGIRFRCRLCHNLPNVGGGENWVEVGQAMDVIIEEYQRRMQARDQHLRSTGSAMPVDRWTRLNVLLDEANITRLRFDVSSRTKGNRWQEFAEVLGSGARKVRISITLLCQSANVEDLGLSGPMRRNFFRIGLDHAIARQMLKDEPNAERRKLLHSQLEGQQFPAVCEYRGQFYALDRTGVDRVPAPRAPQSAVWPGWGTTPQPQAQPAPPSIDELLRRAVRAGWTRRETRVSLQSRGLGFRDEQWTEAERFVRSEKLTGAQIA